MPSDLQYPNLFIFVRHAQSIGNLLTKKERAKLSVGTNFYELTDVGEMQAEITGKWLQNNGLWAPSKILRSFYERTRQTSDIMYPHLPKTDDPRLMELNRGIWHVMTEKEIQQRYPEQIELREKLTPYLYRPISGENWIDAQDRARSFRQTLRECYSGKIVVCFGHGHWHLLFDSVNEKWPFEKIIRRYEADDLVANASVTIYRNNRRPDGSYNLKKVLYKIPWGNRDDIRAIKTS